MNRKLYRSTEGQMIAGVCAGLGKYLDIDPTVIRVVFALLAAFGGGGILLYLILMIVMPPEPALGEPFAGSKTETAAPGASATDSGPMDSEALISSPAPTTSEPIDPVI